MITLLEIREKIAAFYGKYQKVISAACRFAIAFAVFLVILLQLSTQSGWQILLTALIPAALCVFLPYSAISVFAVVLMVVLAWVLDTGVGIAMLLITLAVILLYFVFRPEYGFLAGFSMFLCMAGIPASLPASAGLLCGPTALIPMLIGVVYYDCTSVIRANFSALSSYSTTMSETEKIAYFLEGCLSNSRAMTIAAALSASFLTVWTIRRRPGPRSAGVAVAFGTIVYILAVLAANVLFSVFIDTPGLVAGCVTGTAAAVLITFLRLSVDSSMTELLEYEDEDYHYYVKAVPKLKVEQQSLKVTRITNEDEPLGADDFPQPDNSGQPESSGGSSGGTEIPEPPGKEEGE